MPPKRKLSQPTKEWSTQPAPKKLRAVKNDKITERILKIPIQEAHDTMTTTFTPSGSRTSSRSSGASSSRAFDAESMTTEPFPHSVVVSTVTPNITNTPLQVFEQVHQRLMQLDADVSHTANALEKTLLAFKNTVNHLLYAQSLPSFSGNPLEWLHFKQAYDLCKTHGMYNDKEITIILLSEALKGEARKSVEMLLAVCCSADQIMKTLELKYGNKNLLANKIICDIKNLPSLKVSSERLLEFSIQLLNSVTALKALGLTKYSYYQEIIVEVIRKLPDELKYEFVKQTREPSKDEIELEQLAKFLIREAELRNYFLTTHETSK